MNSKKERGRPCRRIGSKTLTGIGAEARIRELVPDETALSRVARLEKRKTRLDERCRFPRLDLRVIREADTTRESGTRTSTRSVACLVPIERYARLARW